jgi:hypothetical protein
LATEEISCSAELHVEAGLNIPAALPTVFQKKIREGKMHSEEVDAQKCINVSRREAKN